MRLRVASSIDDLSEDTSLGRTKIYEEIKAGNLRAVKCGGRTLILHEDRQRWLSKFKQMEAADAKPAEKRKTEVEDNEDETDAEPS